MLDTKRMRFPIAIILACIRWYAAYPLSFRHINGDPENVTMDKSEANKAAIDGINHDRERAIEVRHITYLNNIASKIIVPSSVTSPMLNIKSFRSARKVWAGIELVHMIRKGQMIISEGNKMSFAEQCYVLAG
ncbi:MAG: DDE-type integrase/transposase/recombinase [Methylococcales bacterium]|nr:DDE-type integrase/transposase/recombinase [Methylococcales bacterium]